jgi:hypothetical protein
LFVFKKEEKKEEEKKAKSHEIELSSKERSSTILSFWSIGRVILEKLALIIKCLLDTLGGVYILLATIHNRHIPYLLDLLLLLFKAVTWKKRRRRRRS